MTQAILARDIARVVLPRDVQNGGLFMLSAYFDDSGTHQGSPLVVWGGAMGTEAQWTKFETAWRALLQAPLPGKPPLKQFHAAACKAGEGEFSGYSSGERDHITYLFRSMMIDAHLTTTASVVCRPDWDELVVGNILKRAGSAEVASFVHCIINALAWAESLSPREPQIALIFDLGRQTPEISEMTSRVLSFDRPTAPVKIAGISFNRVADFPPLQAADMIATESFWAAQRWLENHNNYSARAHFRHMLDNLVSIGWIADRDVILEMIKKYAQDGVYP